MLKSKYKMSKLIEKYYKTWVNGPALLGDINDNERFYRFIKACIHYSKRNINEVWLRHFLERDVKGEPGNKYSDKKIQEITILFQRILDFHATTFPDHVLEMTNPYLVSLQLHRLRGIDKPYLPEEEIEKRITDNFGANWRDDYKKKFGLK